VASLTERFQIVIDAVADGALKTLEKVGITSEAAASAADKLKASFMAGIGIGAGTNAFDAAANAVQRLGQFMLDASKAAGEDARQSASLELIIGNVTDATREQARAASEALTQMGLQTGVADDQLRPAYATLVRQTGELTESHKLLKLALDISAATNTDVGSAADALAKAYNGNTKALKALAPEVAGMIRDGTSLDGIFAQLQDRFSGASATIANADPWLRLDATIQETKETIGAEFLPEIEAAGEVMRNVVFPGVRSLIDGLGELANAAQNAGRAVEQYLDPLGLADKMVGSVEQGHALADALTRAGITAQTSGNRIHATGQAASDAAGSFTSLAAAIDTSDKAFRNVSSSVFGVTNAEQSFFKALQDTDSGQRSATSSAGDLERANRRIEDANRSLADAEANLADAIKHRDDVARGASADDVTRATIALQRARDNEGKASIEYFKAQEKVKKILGDSTASSSDLREAEIDLNEAQRRTVEAALASKDAQTRLNDIKNQGKQGSKDLSDAEKQVEDAQRRVQDAARAVADAQEQATQKTTAAAGSHKTLKERLDDSVKAADGWIGQLKEANAPSEAFGKATDTIAANLREIAKGMGPEAQQLVEDYIGKLRELEAKQQLVSKGLFGFNPTVPNDVAGALTNYLNSFKTGPQTTEVHVYIDGKEVAAALSDSRRAQQ